MRRLNNDKGIALITALWLLVILLVLVSEMVLNAKGDVDVVRNFKEDRESYFLAYGGIQMGFREIIGKSDFHYLGKEGIVFGLAGDELIDEEKSYRTNIPLGSGTVSYFIDDENRKLNINDLARDSLKLGRFVEYSLRESQEDTATIVDSILDWVDADNFHRANGAESDYYQSLEKPYSAKDGEFDSVSELKLVKGVTPNAYKLMEDNLTIYKTAYVNSNTASSAVLYASGMTESKVAELISAREEQTSIDRSAKSNVFTITAIGKVAGSKTVHKIRAVARKQGVQTLVLLNWEDNYYQKARLVNE